MYFYLLMNKDFIIIIIIIIPGLPDQNGHLENSPKNQDCLSRFV